MAHRCTLLLTASASMIAVTGCATAVAGQPTASDADVTSAKFTAVAGTWMGSYTCAQGQTALTLTLTPPSDGNSHFAFGPLPSNPTVPAGAFELTLSFTGDDLVLAPGDWISRPGDCLPVGLRASGPINATADVIRGNVTHGAGCTTFEVRRQAAH